MSLIKKSDVKNHLSPLHQKGIHLYRPTSQPDATGFSGEESGHANATPERATVESTSPSDLAEQNIAPLASDPGLRPVLVPAASKSAQA